LIEDIDLGGLQEGDPLGVTKLFTRMDRYIVRICLSEEVLQFKHFTAQIQDFKIKPKKLGTTLSMVVEEQLELKVLEKYYGNMTD
jgi:hypothetical protein